MNLMRYLIFAAVICFLTSAQSIGQDGVHPNQILSAYVLQGKTLDQLEKSLKAKSDLLVAGLTDSQKLDETQQRKMSKACQADIARFLQDVEELDLHTRHLDMQKMQQNQEEMQRIWPLVMPARQRIETGLHGKGSLFDKTLHQILSDEQRAAYQQQAAARELRLLISITKLTLVEFEKKVPLTGKQRDQIMQLVEESNKPKLTQDGMAFYIGMAILSKLPKEKMQEVLSEEQYKQFQAAFKNANRFGGIQW